MDLTLRSATRSYTYHMVTIEQIEAFVMSPWAIVLLIIVVLSGIWYHVSEGYKASKEPLTVGTPGSLFKTFIWGRPLTLVIIAIVIIGVVMAFTWAEIAQIGA